MSHQPTPSLPSHDAIYDALPLEGEHPQETLYDAPPAPPSPDPRYSQFHTPSYDPFDLPAATPRNSNYLPPGAGPAAPRFLGAALYGDGGGVRDSYASSHGTPTGPYAQSEANSSVYALNERGPGGRDSFAGSGYRDDPFDGDQLRQSPSHGKYLGDKRGAYAAAASGRKKKTTLLAVIGGVIVVAIAVVLVLYFAVFKKKGGSGSGSGSGSSTSAAGASPTSVSAVKTGGNGSKVTMDDGTTFTYTNPYGGTWYWDENDPFNNAAQVNSWTPALNETFQFGVDRIWGVNLGGWLTIEPFITPALFEPYLNNAIVPIDEWTLSEAMSNDTANGGLQQLVTHYETFITEADFAAIAGAGLNFVRISLPFWAIETRDNEPFLPKTAWTYFLKAIKWARKYGIRINLDFHALPGSQNGWNHSGKFGTINMLYGPMGLANAQRSLDYIRIISEFISQPEYSNVIAIFGITNEPFGPTIGQENLSRYYLEAYTYVRSVSGTGAGNGPFISMHDGFMGEAAWAGFLPGSDRIMLDMHPYLAFDGQSSAAMSTYAKTPCSTWGGAFNVSMAKFGLTHAGEFSNAVTDCGLWVNGVNLGTRYEGNYTPGTWPPVGSCEPWTNWTSWDSTMKSATKTFALASMDALQNYFFWTWKIGNSSATGLVEAPAWSYLLGLQEGWMPEDPREAVGQCGNPSPFTGTLSAWQTGGAGAGTIAASATASITWPPTSISNGGFATALPSYTPTGTVATLPPAVFTETGKASGSLTTGGNGWFNPSDTASGMVAIATCSYLDPWIGSAAPPSPLCSGAAKRTAAPEPSITPAPEKA
ncbi:hypothetical protein HWV62_9974 [Athelia sp. TMB]|nr:hypothetical protein HWV62_9974 [Athelia sp. TMB]